jgi:hypothetical protein
MFGNANPFRSTGPKVSARMRNGIPSIAKGCSRWSPLIWHLGRYSHGLQELALQQRLRTKAHTTRRWNVLIG